MKYSYHIISAEKVLIQESNETILSVLFDILETQTYEDGREPLVTTVQTLRHGFALDTEAETVKSELQAVVDTFVSDKENTERNSIQEAAQEKGDATIAALLDDQTKK